MTKLYELEEALNLLEKGQYAIRGEKGNNTEYSMQYFRDMKGNLHWTAGGTVGGRLTDDRKVCHLLYRITESLHD